jgi:hypothetical protein
MGVAATSVTVTAIAVLGGVGALPSAAVDPHASGAGSAAVDTAYHGAPRPSHSPSTAPDPRTVKPSDVRPSGRPVPSQTPSPGTPADPASSSPADPSTGASTGATDPTDEALPADSGEGRRVVFSEARQRVWLVDADDRVQRTYLVSGSLTDNLHPGTYHVYSRSEQAWGIDDSGTMKWFVRFTQGDHAAIGFHDIPVKDGRLVQRRSDLGTPESHGCIRQWRPDARALWRFAQLGTTVVVVA